MVAPIIAGSVRVAKGAARTGKNPAQTARKGRAAKRRPELLRRVSARERRNEREKEPLSTESKYAQQQNTKKILRTRRRYGGKVKKIGNFLGIEENTNLRRIQASAAAWAIVAFITPFLLLQFSIWIIAMVGVGVETVPILGYVLPGEDVFQVASIFVSILGLIYMIIAAAVFMARGVQCFGTWKTFIYLACFAGSLAPFINFVPFVFIWCGFVVILQNEEGDNTEDV